MIGRYEITLSAQGRLKLRKPFVSQNERVFLTNHIAPGGQRCLLGFSPEYWLKFLEQLEVSRGRGPQLLAAFYGGGTHELALDKNGAIVIPPPLLKFAGLKQRVTLVEMEIGVDRFELWNPKFYEAAREQAEKDQLGPLEAFSARLK